MESLLSHQLTRQTCIIALGGGATGDFAGFIAATLLRGVGFIKFLLRFSHMIQVLAEK